MKKFLLGITAAAVAATMCFAFTACNNTNAPVGDNSVLTEEQWVQAFEDSVMATNYKYLQLLTETGKTYNDDDELVYAVRTDISEVDYDGAGLKAYSKYERYITIGKAEPTKLISIRYFEVLDSTFIKYGYDENYGWYADSEDYDTNYEAAGDFQAYVSNGVLGSLLTVQFQGTGDKQEVSGSVDELYSLFSYNSKTCVYSATIKTVSDYLEMSIQISFKNGKIYKIINNYVQGEGDEAITTHAEATITYGGVSVTIPQEAKDALQTEEE